MTPKLLRVQMWDYRPYAKLGDGEVLPIGSARFDLNSGKWYDVISAHAPGLMVSANVAEVLRLIQVPHGEIVSYLPYVSTLFGKIPPPPVTYFHWKPAETIQVGELLIQEDKYSPIYRWIPLESQPPAAYGLTKGRHSGCLFCTIEILLLARKNRWSNFWFRPLDLPENVDVFTPPFQIDYLGKQWPPQWYPDGFEPHPNNLTDEVPADPLKKGAAK